MVETPKKKGTEEEKKNLKKKKKKMILINYNNNNNKASLPTQKIIVISKTDFLVALLFCFLCESDALFATGMSA